MIGEWVDEAFAALPGCDGDLFRQLLEERKLKFNNQELLLDIIDKRNVRLICAALYMRKSLFLELPDSRTHRPALLCAVALLQSWLDAYEKYLPTQTMLYFGSTVGIREHLRHTTVGKINLAEVFNQRDVGRHNLTPSSRTKRSVSVDSFSMSLPRIVTIYAPVEPEQIIKEYKPAWIAIDCDDVPHLDWLKPLLEYAAKKHIPVIGWGNNPLSECISQFADFCPVFCWPPQFVRTEMTVAESAKDLVSRLLSAGCPQVRPVVMQGTGIDTLETPLHKARQALIRAFQLSVGRLGQEAIHLHWRYLRALEVLAIPFEFYEVEVCNYWGLQSFQQLQNACQLFREACQQYNKSLTFYLNEANSYLEAAQDYIQHTGNPLWGALTNICIEEPPPGRTLLVTFTSRARKQLFLSALLARLNITEEDLGTLNISITSLDELRYLNRKRNESDDKQEDNPFHPERSLCFYPLLVGLPSSSLNPKVTPILLYEKIDVLIYSYQHASLMQRQREWATALEPDLSQMVDVLSQFSGMHKPLDITSEKNLPILDEPVGIEVKGGQRKRLPHIAPLWQPVDPLLEIAYLLEVDEEKEEESFPIESNSKAQLGNTANIEEVWCKTGIEIDFDQGWHAIFAPDDFINVIVSGASGLHTDYRSVRSLQPNNRVVVVPGQQRQNLYVLLISRVHNLPSLELNLALIRRWQEDFVIAYRDWCQSGWHNAEELIRLLKKRDSKITSPATINLWLRGKILCPDDVEDLRRLTEILTMDFVHQHYRKIYKAANSLRILHRKLSKQLNRWLNQETAGLIVNDSNSIIDEELGITFEDFRESLRILSVRNVRLVTGPFLRSRMGRLEKDDRP